MGKALVEKSTGKVIGWSRWDDFKDSPDFDPSYHVVVSASAPPNAEEVVWDGRNGLRRAAARDKQKLATIAADAAVDEFLQTDGINSIDTCAVLSLLSVIASATGKPIDTIRQEFKGTMSKLLQKMGS